MRGLQKNRVLGCISLTFTSKSHRIFIVTVTEPHGTSQLMFTTVFTDVHGVVALQNSKGGVTCNYAC